MSSALPVDRASAPPPFPPWAPRPSAAQLKLGGRQRVLPEQVGGWGGKLIRNETRAQRATSSLTNRCDRALELSLPSKLPPTEGCWEDLQLYWLPAAPSRLHRIAGTAATRTRVGPSRGVAWRGVVAWRGAARPVGRPEARVSVLCSHWSQCSPPHASSERDGACRTV